MQEPYQIALTVDNLNDAVLFLEIEPAGEGAVRPGLWLSTYDLPADDVAAIRQRVSALYHDALA